MYPSERLRIYFENVAKHRALDPAGFNARHAHGCNVIARALRPKVTQASIIEMVKRTGRVPMKENG